MPKLHPTVAPSASVTATVEDYLKTIYRLSQAGQPAATNDIAGFLGLSAPSVSGMIKRMSGRGLVVHTPYRGVELTAQGRRLALVVLRRHRVLESYLVALLGYTWDSVHEEAERLEHAVSAELVERMADALGNPGYDPHGDPIPTADGTVSETVRTSLHDVPVGATAALQRVASDDPDRLRFLGSMGLRPGALLSVVGRQPFHGPVTVRVNDRELVIGNQMASSLYCVISGRAQ